MLNVIIDTSIFRQNPKLDNASFTTLYRLGKEKLVKLHVPYVVEYEFLTKKQIDAVAPFKEINKNIHELLKQNLNENDSTKIHKFQKELKKIEKKHLESLETNFDKWLKSQNAEIIEINPSHGKKVMDSYFKGSPPFKSIKNRNDIPDAYIWQNILDISELFSQLFIITQDGKLFDESQNKNKLIPFKSLQEFIESEYLKQAISDKLGEQYFDKIVEKLSSNKEYLVKQVNIDLVDKLFGEDVIHTKIPDDNNEGVIGAVYEAEDIDFSFDKSKYYGDGLILIPFSLEVLCTLWYHIFKTDYLTMSEERTQNISVSEYDNKHYYQAEEDYNIFIDGYISINVVFSSLDDVITEIESFNKILSQSEILIDEINEIKVFDDFGDDY